MKTRRQRPSDLLKDVSRSFYLTLRVLPYDIRGQIATAYLLARTTDTIADTEVLPAERRLEALSQVRQRIQGRRIAALDLTDFLSHPTTPEGRLLALAEENIRRLDDFLPNDRRHVREVLDTIGDGQEADLRRFGTECGESIVALQQQEELEDYTYQVAGCVGLFWTRICLDHLSGTPSASRTDLDRWGIQFGKGLQLINILRDLSRDVREGRCYLPEAELNRHGLSTSDLTDPRKESALRPLYNAYLRRARAHLQAGWHYTMSLPSGWTRVRLACVWPIFIGLRTLKKLRLEPVLDPARPVKVGRHEVYQWIIRTLLTARHPSWWQAHFDRMCSQIPD